MSSIAIEIGLFHFLFVKTQIPSNESNITKLIILENRFFSNTHSKITKFWRNTLSYVYNLS